MKASNLKFMGETKLEVMGFSNDDIAQVTLPNDQLFIDMDNIVFSAMYSETTYSDKTESSQLTRLFSNPKILSG
jgi:hypothetical protein